MDLFGKLCAFAVIIAMLEGCAGPTLKQFAADPAKVARQADQLRTIKLNSWFDDMSRLVTVGYHVGVAARDECAQSVKPVVGVFVVNLAVLSREFWPAGRVKGIGTAPKIISVVPGSPAETAGLWPEDVIIEVAGRPIAEDGRAPQQIANLVRATTGQPGGTEFVVLRDGWELVFSVIPVHSCDYSLEVLEGKAVTAFADGESISVHRSLLRYVRNDHELAMIMAHELSHNVLDHRGSKLKNAAVGAVVGFAADVLAGAVGVDTDAEFTMSGMQAGAAAYEKEFEAEADYMALYMLARAGYDVEAGANLVRRMETFSRANLDYALDHFAYHGRVRALGQVTAEIDGKRKAGLPLYPDRAK